MFELNYKRHLYETLVIRLAEFPRYIIFVAGPRQVGKTTLVRQVLAEGYSPAQYSFLSVDQPDGDVSAAPDQRRRTDWLIDHWNDARARARRFERPYILVFDEIQKIPGWSEVVKGLWDADRAEKLNLKVVLLGSSPLLMQKGFTESLMGRYELLRLTHWSFPEMSEAFNFNLDEYLYFGGYPGASPLIRDESRWREYVQNSLVLPSIEKDILMMTRVDKPALLKQFFSFICQYSGQELSLNKCLGPLTDAGNTTTLAHYSNLLAEAGMLVGIQKYSSKPIRRASVSKWNVLNSALMSVRSGYTYAEALADRSHYGRLVETAVGAHLYNTGHPECEVYYWRDNSNESTEVDFVVKLGSKLTAVEVKSGTARPREDYRGLLAFETQFGPCRKILVGQGGVSLTEFLSYPARHWLP